MTDVIATVPTLTTLVAAVGADSGLGPNVDLLPSLTLFAPANSAFQALAKAYPAITSATGGEITGLILNHAVVGTVRRFPSLLSPFRSLCHSSTRPTSRGSPLDRLSPRLEDRDSPSSRIPRESTSSPAPSSPR